MNSSTKKDYDYLVDAYISMYQEQKHDCDKVHPGETHEHWKKTSESEHVNNEQAQDDDNEGEKMDAALEIKASEQDAKDQNKDLPNDVKLAAREADKYIDKKVQKLKNN